MPYVMEIDPVLFLVVPAVDDHSIKAGRVLSESRPQDVGLFRSRIEP